MYLPQFSSVLIEDKIFSRSLLQGPLGTLLRTRHEISCHIDIVDKTIVQLTRVSFLLFSIRVLYIISYSICIRHLFLPRCEIVIDLKMNIFSVKPHHQIFRPIWPVLPIEETLLPPRRHFRQRGDGEEELFGKRESRLQLTANAWGSRQLT